MNDLGFGGDAIVNDNIHTKVFRMHGPGIGRDSRLFRSFYSTTDLATLFTEDGGYNSITWSIPYKSQRSEKLVGLCDEVSIRSVCGNYSLRLYRHYSNGWYR